MQNSTMKVFTLQLIQVAATHCAYLVFWQSIYMNITNGNQGTSQGSICTTIYQVTIDSGVYILA